MPKPDDAADVVAREVDQHDVLGAFLRVLAQLCRHQAIVLLGPAAEPGAGDRAADHATAEHLHHRLGRRADERGLLVAQEVHVRRRVHLAQHAVHVERLVVTFEIEALREHHLEDVAGEDVLARHLDGPLVARGSERGRERWQLGELVVRRRRRHVRQRSGELVHQVVEPPHRSGVRRVDRVRAGIGREEDVLDEVETLAVVVERGDVPGERQHRIGPADRIGGPVRKVLDLAHHVVAEVADDSPVKRR